MLDSSLVTDRSRRSAAGAAAAVSPGSVRSFERVVLGERIPPTGQKGSLFAERLRNSCQERAVVLERERGLLHQQLHDLRSKAAAEDKRGWVLRRSST